MNLERHIAWRYLFSKKGHNAINIVTGVSSAAVAVVTAAMICVLSVMNGFGSLVEQLFSEFDAPLLVVPAEGATLRTDEPAIQALHEREDLIISAQLEQTALVRYKDHQTPARLLGVDSLFAATAHIDSIITDGFYSVWAFNINSIYGPVYILIFRSAWYIYGTIPSSVKCCSIAFQGGRFVKKNNFL